MSEAAMGDRELEVARRLFEEGWSGGHPEAPLPFLTDDAVMRDILGHPEAMRGHAQIVEFFGPVAKHLRVWPEEYFLSDDGIALTAVDVANLPLGNLQRRSAEGVGRDGLPAKAATEQEDRNGGARAHVEEMILPKRVDANGRSQA